MKSSRVLTIMFVFSFTLLPLAHASTEPSGLLGIEEKALAYIEHVLPLDFAHYQITNDSYELPEMPNATYRTDAVTFTLNSSDSMLVVNCMFRDGVQYTCDMSIQNGSPVYVRDCSDPVKVTRIIIEGHQAQTGVDCSYLLKTLGMVTSTENVTTVILGNVKLTLCSRVFPMGMLTTSGGDGTLHIQVDPSNIRNITSFHWAYNEGSGQIMFSLDFDNGNLYSLHDERIINDFTISQADDGIEARNVTGQSPISNGTKSERSQEQPAIQSQSEPTSSPLVSLAVALVLGAATACVGAVFYHKRHLEPKESSSIPITQDEAESF